MGVDTKGCLVTEEKNPFKIGHHVHKAITDLIKNVSKMTSFELSRSEDYKMPSIEMWDWADALTIDFRFKGEDRSLNIQFDCDCDLKIHPEVEGTSCVWFSLGCWGSSEDLMLAAIDSVRQYGKVYIDVNDCDSVGFVEA